jgi:phosphoribosylanthranilate isomerase
VEQAKPIFAAKPSGAKRVALSLSSQLAEVERVVRETRPDIIQIQAGIEDFSVAMTRVLKARFPEIPVMRAIPVIDESSIEIADSYRGAADFLLLDSYDAGSKQFGALGLTHDWSLSRRIVARASVPVVLAGGLGPENVAEAIAAVQPAGVDSQTKTNLAGGPAKDLEKVRRFVDAEKLTTSRQ